MGGPGVTGLRSHLEALFREELEDNLGVLRHGLRELEDLSDEDVTAALVQDLFRAAHSLKGAAHSAGVAQAVRPCRRLEERLAAVRAGESTVDDQFLAVVSEEVSALAELRTQLSGGPPMGDPAPALGLGRDGHPSTHPVESRARVAVRALDDLVHQSAALSSLNDQFQVLTEYLGILRQTTPGALDEIISDFGDLERALRRGVAQISVTAQRLRMEPLDDVVSGIDHIVRELCRVTGKRARLVVEGGHVEVDRDVADAIREPLLHLVRNAVDHGIEEPGIRTAAGKAAEGVIRVSAALDGGRVRLSVSDDGAGLDALALRTAAGRAESATDPAELAFRPGVSTAPAVTDVSGRGVGLDAVRARIESLGGSVRLHSRAGGGTEAVVLVPTSLAVLRIILVRVGAQLVALPVASVERLHRAARGSARVVDDQLSVTTNGIRRPAVHLGAALGLAADEMLDRPMTIVELAGEPTVLLVDAVESDREALLQPLPPRVSGNRMLLGAVLLPQDRVALVVNPSTCARHGRA